MRLSMTIFIPLLLVSAFVVRAAENTMQLSALQQQGVSALRFGHAEFDFGAIEEQKGKVTHSFSFVNTGSTPVVVVSASSSCGCTVPTFSRKPVMPGEEGFITVTYDPENRPGAFDKQITVTTSEQAPPLKLRITGSVVPRPRTLEEDFPYYAGSGIRLEEGFHAFSYIEKGKPLFTTIGIINTSDREVRIRIRPSGEGAIFTASAPAKLAAGERAVIEIAAAADEENCFYGTRTESLAIELDGRRSDAAITVTGIVIDRRDREFAEGAPRFDTDRSTVTFGTVKHSDAPLERTFRIENAGDAELHVRAVESSLRAGTDISLKAGDSVAAGGSLEVKVRLAPRQGGYGPSVGHIRIITDDPQRPMRDVKVVSTITE